MSSDEPVAAPEPGVRSSLHDLVGLVELNRPPHNFVDRDLLTAIADAMEELAAAPECRAIVLAAEGKSFCAGANFADPGSQAEPGTSVQESFRALAEHIYGQAERIFAVHVPVVAAVHGPAVGAGLGLALACDLRVSCPDAFFAANFVGLHPGFAISITLPDLVGPSRAADMLLTGRRVGGGEAFAIGLAERLVPPDDVRQTALGLAREIAGAAPLGVAATRQTVRAGLLWRVRETIAREVEEQVRLIGTADAAEGIAAMLQKRTPNFEGR